MNRCNQCMVYVQDDSERCPLCNLVLTNDKNQGMNKYPDVRGLTRRFRLFENIILFLTIAVETVLIYVNYKVDWEVKWSFIVGLILIYLNVLLRLTIIGKAGYRIKTFGTTIIALFMFYGIDRLTGNFGWSLNYLLPAATMAIDLAIAILMIVNRRNWQSYIMLQIMTVLLGIVPFIFKLFGLVTDVRVALIALFVSLLLFVGTVIIGDQRARTELKRRFHV